MKNLSKEGMYMSFYAQYQSYHSFDFSQFFESITPNSIASILQKEKLTPLDFLALLSPAAASFLETMAQKAQGLTLQHFGKSILLYTPMYVSDYCTNQCKYCGFNSSNAFPRKQLSLEEVEAEAKAIAATGLKHILLLTGDAKGIATISYLKDCIGILKKYFTSIGIEIYALTTEEYETLIEAGVDSLCIYQETYNEALYDDLHIKGPKKDYHFRLEAPERAAAAGIRSINVGALLGLDDWRKDAFFTALHAGYLQDQHSELEVSISLPRMRPSLGGFQPTSVVSDRDLVQFMVAFRLFMPRAGITLSTRESQSFRDNVLPLGVTKMSAGSCTAVGGHIAPKESTPQFDISDDRSVEEMTEALYNRGYQPVFKDWQCL